MIENYGAQVNVIDDVSQSIFVIISPYLTLSHDLKKHIYKNYFYKRVLLCDHLFYTELEGIKWSEKEKAVYEKIKMEKTVYFDRRKYNNNRIFIEQIAYVFVRCGANIIYAVPRNKDENITTNKMINTYKFDFNKSYREGQTFLAFKNNKGFLIVVNTIDLCMKIPDTIDLFIVCIMSDDLFYSSNENIVKILY